ncbi:hypothetical protein HYZ78_00315 [Candidatus Microgenomates bacterium]|nr:hypothetical protein [Candidatus Microgenomates bacterium]
MAQTVTIDSKTTKEILTILRYLKKEINLLREKFDAEPPYGSDAWWEWSDKKAEEDIRTGRYTKVSNKKELQKYLDSLKAA